MKLSANASAFLLCFALWSPKAAVVNSAPDSLSLPSVELTASRGPRDIEDLTRQKVLHDYAAARQTLAAGLEQNRAELLNDYFTGSAKKEFTQAIAEQIGAGIHPQCLYPGWRRHQ